MDFLRLVIIKICEVKDIEIGSNYDYGYQGIDILENYFTNGQHNICVFQQFTSNFEHKKVASGSNACFSPLLYSSSFRFPCKCIELRCWHRHSGFRVSILNYVVGIVSPVSV